MLLPIPIGSFVAIFLIISGVLNCMDFLDARPEDCTRADLLNGLAHEGWGIIAASCILLLIQINRQLESLRFEAAKNTPAPIPQKKVKAKVKSEQKEEKEQKEQEPAPASTPPVNVPRQVYPNSPIPGGGRVPQTQATPAPGAKLPTRREEPEKLSYFKVD